MPRVKHSPTTHRRKKKILKAARGFRGGRSRMFSRATESVDRAMTLATEHRRLKKRDYRRLWISRLSAACRANGITYSRFIQGLGKADIALNRKMLSEVAIHDPAGFANLVERAQAALSG